jgi:hypothetical protein
VVYLGGLLDIRSWNLDKNLHLTWVDGKTDVDVNFYHKGRDKSPVAAQLSSLNESEKMKSRGTVCRFPYEVFLQEAHSLMYLSILAFLNLSPLFHPIKPIIHPKADLFSVFYILNIFIVE